jgi:uncharacterized protein (DUF2141 family)
MNPIFKDGIHPESTMQKKIVASYLAGFALFFSLPAEAELPSLAVYVTYALPATGTLEITLFNSEENFMQEAFLQLSGEVKEDGTYSGYFASLEEGDYALVVVNDENDNGEYDSGFLGFGAEPLGYSNNVRALLGRPDFDDVKFSIGPGVNEIKISLD